MRGVTSVLRDKEGRVVLRLYLNETGSEYYEVSMKPEEAVSLGTDLLVGARTTAYYAGGIGGTRGRSRDD